jgi:phospholipid/cholesterol/gamma-HCH transport system substrate-binding protein
VNHRNGDEAESPTLSRGNGREVWIGLFVLLGIAAILLVLFTMTSPSLFRGRYRVTALVNDAGGIRRGDPVELKGVNIGRVISLQIKPAGVAVTLELEKEYPVPRDSEVLLAPRGLLGDMAAQVLLGRDPEPLRNGDVVPGASQEKAGTSVARIASESEQVLTRAQALLSPQTIEGVQSSSVELSNLLKTLSVLAEGERVDLGEVSQSLRRSAGNVERLSGAPELEGTLRALKSAATRIDGVTPELEASMEALSRSSRSMESLLGRIERGEGTLGRLSKDDALFVNANQAALDMSHAALELGRLTDDMRRNPKRYVKLSLF